MELSSDVIAWAVSSAVVALALGVWGGWRIKQRWMELSKGEMTSRPPEVTARTFVAILFLLVAGAAWLIYKVAQRSDSPEIQMGVLVVAAIAALMTVLFIVAAGFSSMKLTDPKQPLGLPEGSIRALIALVLIMVFIIFGIYLFRIVGAGDYLFLETRATPPAAADYPGQRVLINQKDGKYNVWVLSTTNEDGKRLAQQLITTVGTLVVAVAGFYFGSSAVSSAVAAVQGAASSEPKIKDLTPKEGVKGKQIDLEIEGADFKGPKAVRLVRGSEIMAGTDILSNAAKVRCKVMIDKDPDGKWDLVVENEDGKQARLAETFTIKPS